MTPDDPVVARLREVGCVFAEDEARLLRDHTADPVEFERMLAQRLAGVPLEHVLGWAEFCGVRVAVAPGVFVPRQRSAFLVEVATGLLAASDVPGAATASRPLVLDLCCGSGALGLALALRHPVQLLAADLDPAAVACARRNLVAVGGVAVESDLFNGLPRGVRGGIRLILANAPYVPSDAIATMPPEARDHERRMALDGGHDGLELHRRIAAEAGRWLQPGGVLVIETSAGQADAATAAFRDAGLTPAVHRSDELDATVVTGTRPG